MTVFCIDAKALKAVSMAAEKKDHSRPVLTCVLVKPGEIVATDSYRMNRYIFDIELEGVPEDGILFDAELFSKIKASQNFVRFEELEDGYWLVDSVRTRPIEGNFPSSYASLFKMEDGACSEFGINPNYVADAMKAVKVINGSRNKNAYAIVSSYDPMKPIHIGASHDSHFEAIIMPVRVS